MRKCFVAVMFVFILGCAGGRIFEPSLVDENIYAEATFLRVRKAYGCAGFMTVKINGIDVARVFGGDHVTIKVNPGEHVVTSSWVRSESIKKTFEKGSRYYFKLEYKGNDPGQLTTISEMEATNIIAGRDGEAPFVKID